MNVLGSKVRKARKIGVVLNGVLSLYPEAEYWEPFMGSCAITAVIDPTRRRVASDLNEDLVKLFLALKNGWTPPTSVSKERWREYREEYRAGVRSPDHTFVGFACSYSSNWYAAYAKGSDTKDISKTLLERFRRGKLSEVEFSCRDYRGIEGLIPKGSVLLLDPPYEAVAKQRRLEDPVLMQKDFWEWATYMSADYGCKVYVTNYYVPSEWKPILDIGSYISIASNSPSRWQSEYMMRLRRKGEE